MEDIQTEKAVQKSSKKRYLLISVFVLLVVLFIGAAAAAGYFYMQSKRSSGTNTSSPEATKELEQIRGAIGKLMELPIGTPTLATITDKTKLANQPFFQKAENGDKLLFFTEEKRAILYRPSSNKIIDVTTINITDNKSAADQATAPEQRPAQDGVSESTPMTEDKEASATVTAALYNGSAKIGATNSMEDTVIAKFPRITVEKKEKALKDDYTGTLVVDLTGKNTDLVEKVAQEIGGITASALPAEEVNPGTEILIIVGNK